VIQQGQVFKLTAKGADGEPLWAYRYRLEGRSSARPQVGGFASRAEAQKDGLVVALASRLLASGHDDALAVVEMPMSSPLAMLAVSG
jgi:hypothetical protein